MKGDIPVLNVVGQNLPATWEQSVIETWQHGVQVPTEHDRKGDPPSRDCTMVLIVQDPLAEPRIHRSFPATLGDLEIYRQEVLVGIHDDRVGEHGWSYSYHDRMRNYPPGVDQIEYIIEKLAEALYTRRAQATSWIPEIDSKISEPPCFQRLWCRGFLDEKNQPVLNLNIHWRSRDAFKAAFMNMWAYIELQRDIAKQVGERIGERVILGRYVDISDSYHINGKDWGEVEKFLHSVKTRNFKERTWTTAFAKPFFERARQKIKLEQKEG